MTTWSSLEYFHSGIAAAGQYNLAWIAEEMLQKLSP
jgi:hypothetical protein